MGEIKNISAYGIFVWLLGVLFFLFEFFLRIFLGTIANEITLDLNLSIEQFSLVGAAYYVTYGAMQIPVGILTEKIGTRIILPLATSICVIGVFLMTVSHSFYPALISRLLIGFGSSFGFVSLLILALNWFPKKYFGFMCGISLFLGAMGPMLAGAPLAYLFDLMNGNWRLILFWIGIFGVVLALIFALFMRDKPKKQTQQIIFITPYESVMHRLVLLLKNPQTWFILVCGSLFYCPIPIFAAYFGTSYLQLQGFDRTTAAFIISMLWIGYAIGNPLIGKLSDQLKRRVPFLSFFGFMGCVASVLLLYFPFNYYFLLISLFFILGLASSAQGLSYALIIEHTPKKLHSVALGLANTGGMIFSAFIPSVAGSIIHAGQLASGRQVPSTIEYIEGFSLIPVLYLIAGFIALTCIKETYCRSQHEVHKLPSLHKASDFL